MFKRVLRPLVVTTFAAVALTAFAVASAAPAETTSHRNCSPDGDTGNTICYTFHVVEKESTNKAGVSKTSATVNMLIEYFDPAGNLIWDDTTRRHDAEVVKDGETQVYKSQTKATYHYEGQTCTASANVTYANGEIRHLGPEWGWSCK